MDYDPDLENNEENSIKTKDIMEIQLTKVKIYITRVCNKGSYYTSLILLHD